MGPYAATKHAVVGLSKSLRRELEARGADVGVSVVCPGEIKTTLVHKINARPGRAATALPPDAQGLLGMLHQGNEQGMTPRDAGEIVVDAVRDGRFWVLPNGGQHLGLVRAELDELFASP